MGLNVSADISGNVLMVTLSGKLTREDYELFVPQVDKLIEEHGSLSLLVELEDFHGWSAGALWEDTKFAARHVTDIDRLAIVGDKLWEKGMALFCKPFTTAEVRFFPREEREQAEAWVQGEE
jgi:hypothetical protein